MKKSFSIVLSLAFLLPFNTAYANDGVVNGDLTYEEGAKVYVQTVEDKNLLKEKYQEILKYKEDKNVDKNEDSLYHPMANPDGELYTLSVPVFEQIYDYFSGPATVKQVAHFINGYSSSQTYYGVQLGTTTRGTEMTLIADFLKSNVEPLYIYSSIGTFGSWMDKINYGMRYRMPAVIGINTEKVSAFPYNVFGHYVNTSGYDTKLGLRVRITDPYGPGLGNRWYDAMDVYTANKNHFKQAIIW